jgi:hypothetical protein
MYDSLRSWARRTTTSFAELWTHSAAHGAPHGPRPPARSEPAPADGLIYRLRHWPDLPPGLRTACVFRVLSVMSNRPVNRSWILASSKLAPRQVDALLERLVRDGAVEACALDRGPRTDC